MPGSDMMADSTLTVDKIEASRETRLVLVHVVGLPRFGGAACRMTSLINPRLTQVLQVRACSYGVVV